MSGIHHLDLVVSDLDRSLAFYRGLLGPLGYVREGSIVGERGERVVYLGHIDASSAVGLRERQSDAHPVPYPEDSALTAALIDLSERVARLEGR